MNWLIEPSVCPGLFYATPAQDGFLIRIRTPGGLLNAQQGEAIAALVQQWGSEAIQVTNRANLQIRAVPALPTVEVLQTLQSVGLAAENPAIDHLRNIMTSPTAGIDPHELIDTRLLVKALDAWIQSDAKLAGLPAKFSIGIDGGGMVGIGDRSAAAWEHRYNEIQLSALFAEKKPVEKKPVEEKPGNSVYFQLAIGADKRLHHTGVLLQPHECVEAIAALAKVYLDYVKQASPSQKKPRIKHLLRDWGIEGLLQRVDRQLDRPLRRTETSLLPSAQQFRHLGIHSQRQTGLVYLGIPLPLGQLAANQLDGLVQLAKTSGSGDLRLTPWQTVLLPDIPDAQLPAVLHQLAALDLSISDNRVDTAIVACAGKPGCAASATQTQPHAIALAHHLRQQITLNNPINIHLTGCSKSCAQPSPAEITLLGTAIQIDSDAEGQKEGKKGQLLEGYQVYLGGKAIDDRSVNHQKQSPDAIGEAGSDTKSEIVGQKVQHYLCDAIAAELPFLIEKLLNLYKQHRETANESLSEFVERFSVAELRRSICSTETRPTETRPTELLNKAIPAKCDSGILQAEYGQGAQTEPASNQLTCVSGSVAFLSPI